MKRILIFDATFNPCLKESARNAIALREFVPEFQCHEKFPATGGGEGEPACRWVKFTSLCWGGSPSTKRQGEKGFSRDSLL